MPAESTAPGAGAPVSPEADQLARERDEFKDLLLRKTAEFDNYRKRVERERREQAERAAAELVTRPAAGARRPRTRARARTSGEQRGRRTARAWS